MFFFADTLLDSAFVTAAATYLRNQLNFNIFGFDVIVEAGTGMLTSSYALPCCFGCEIHNVKSICCRVCTLKHDVVVGWQVSTMSWISITSHL